MTQTVQPHFSALLGERGKDLTGDKGETEDDINILLSVYDSLNNLSEALRRLDYVQDNLCKKLNRLDDIIHNI
jgi:hypothetical protein